MKKRLGKLARNRAFIAAWWMPIIGASDEE
jgi:hypothetical protein